MFCPSCGASIQSGQKFCSSCGSPQTASGIAGDATAAAQVPSEESDGPPTPPMGNPLPPPAMTASATTVLPAMNVVEQTSTAYQGPAWDAVGGSDWEATGQTPVVSGVQPFRLTPMVTVSSLAAVLAVASAFVTVAGIEVSDASGLPATEQLFKLNDFSTNLLIGTIIAGLVLVAGSSMGATGRRLGTGLAGGAGLALAGTMGMVVGQVTRLFDSTELGLITSGGSFTLTVTRDIGFWLAIAAALLGAAAFVLSFESAGHDGHPPIHSAVAAVGLLGTAMAVIGPMIPLNGVPFGDQFSNDFEPPATLLLRHLVLILIAVGGVIGFTRNRRWGLGMALGAISIAAWQMMTAVTEAGDIPLSYAGGNPGALDFAPHAVTIIGVLAMIVAGVGGLILASQRSSS